MELFLVFARLGCLSLGAAISVLPEMARQLVSIHQWLTPQQFADGYALGQLAPGPNMLAVFFYGFKIAGLPGALAAGLGMFGPPLLITLCITTLWRRVNGHPWAVALQQTLLPVGAGLMAAGVLALGRAALHNVPLMLIALLSGLVIHRTRLNPALAVLMGGVAGVLLEVTSGQ